MQRPTVQEQQSLDPSMWYSSWRRSHVPIGPPSTFKNNLELSTARAVTVTDFIVEKGMNPAHLSAAGYSAYQPVASNATEAGRQENRRIEIVLEGPGA